jgi:flavorubredoxin
VEQPSTCVDHIVRGIHRIATWVPQAGITVNQFPIEDERPALVHTGVPQLYDGVRRAVAEVLDPAKLEYIALLHFEADECGGMDRFLTAEPDSTLVASPVSAGLNLAGWDYQGDVRGFSDGEVLDLGQHRLRFLETPHVHHWDSMMIFEETTRGVFPSDLYIQPGEQPQTVAQDLGEEMCSYYREIGIFAHERPVRAVVDRLEALAPAWTHAMHGGSLTRDVIPRYTRAPRGRTFAYDGTLLGREVPAPDGAVPSMGAEPADAGQADVPAQTHQ